MKRLKQNGGDNEIVELHETGQAGRLYSFVTNFINNKP